MSHSVTHRSIDSDLFPMTEKQLTLDWARKTYFNFHLFDRSHVPTSKYGSDDELRKWILKAKSLMREIKIKGSHAGKLEVIRIACNEYDLHLPQKPGDFVSLPQKPLNIKEVVAIVSDPTWYYSNKTYNQNVIHHLVYGLTRKSNNLWLIDIEREWLKDYQITYNYDNCTRITDSRGFVYKLMNSTFSNTISKMFKRAMVSKLGEYITVRDKDQMISKIDSGEREDLEYEVRTFTHGKGVVISKKHKNHTLPTITNRIICDDSQLGLWIKQCISEGMDWNHVQTKVKQIFIQEYEMSQNAITANEKSKFNKQKSTRTIKDVVTNISKGMCMII